MSAQNPHESPSESFHTLPEVPRLPDPMETPAPGELTAPHVSLRSLKAQAPADTTAGRSTGPRALSVPPLPVAVGRSAGFPDVPGYVVLEELAKGGMGAVYLARDLALGREVAIKTLLPHLAGHPAMVSQFDREARITACLPHPGVPPVHALGTLPDGRPFLAMKLIRGRTLAAILHARKSLSSQSTADLDPTTPDAPGLLQVFEQICLAVAFAHSQDIIHRDLKPLNIMVGSFGEVQVMDWGLARSMVKGQGVGVGEDQDPELAATGCGADDGADGTIQGQAKGTPGYMPPEQARGEWDAVTARADVFAIGGILCTLLTGSPPYTGDRAIEVLRKAQAADLRDTFRRLDLCGADLELVRLAQWCLSPRADDRPPDARAVVGLVETYRIGQEERVRHLEFERAAAAAKAEDAIRRATTEAAAKRLAEERAEQATWLADAAHARDRFWRWLIALVATAIGLIVGCRGALIWKGVLGSIDANSTWHSFRAVS